MKLLRRPIVILGAARSGTKMLRSLLAAHPAVSTVPWDVNFIWKYGNYAHPDDELDPRDFTARTRQFIQRSLGQFQAPASTHLVEKTVGNTLRPAFVQAALPGCVFVHLIRDGRDVAESARRMWRAPMEWRAVAQKLRAFPPAALPTYGVQYARAYVERRLGLRDGAVGTWGPRWRGIDRDVEVMPLIDVCARQWVRSVETSRAWLADSASAPALEIRYEQLCAQPVVEARRLLEFVGLDPSEAVEEHASRTIVTTHQHKSRTGLTTDDLTAISAEAGPLLEQLGYLGK